MCLYGGRTTYLCGHTFGEDKLIDFCDGVKDLRKQQLGYYQCPRTPNNLQAPKINNDPCHECQFVLEKSAGELPARLRLGDEVYNRIKGWEKPKKPVEPTNTNTNTKTERFPDL